MERAALGEYTTPLMQWTDAEPVWLKCDHLLPTGSFKDRGARSVVARALELGVGEVVVDSSGNAGAALAAHAARARIRCTVFVPAKTSKIKVAQILRYGAAVHLVEGSRESCEAAALAHAASNDAFYASHSTNPYFHDGTKSWLYEIIEQLHSVNALVLPVGSGSLLLGLLRAIDELQATGWITRPPQIILAQALGYASLAPQGSTVVPPDPDAEHPVAEGIAIQSPARLTQLKARLATLDVTVSVVNSYQVLRAQDELARGGFYVEPTSAAAWAAWRHIEPSGPSVVALTGHGLKTTV